VSCSAAWRPERTTPDLSQRTERLARAHDALAPSYDATLAENPVAGWMRRQLWEHYARVFPPGGRLLDLAAGTGADALHLAASGYDVVAVDVSPRMIAQLERHALSERIETHVMAAEQLSDVHLGQFDGVVSAFAGLNTIEDLPKLSKNLARLLTRRGRLVVHALNAFCLWETVNRLLHGQPPRRRHEDTTIGGELIHHRFYDPLTLYCSVFIEEFVCRDVYALSVIAAPTWLRRAPRMAPLFLDLDRVVGRLFPQAGDFFVLDLEKR
jgi:ubiquinone/menaquinone biosynthesis C-methylase UbiE